MLEYAEKYEENKAEFEELGVEEKKSFAFLEDKKDRELCFEEIKDKFLRIDNLKTVYQNEEEHEEKVFKKAMRRLKELESDLGYVTKRCKVKWKEEY